MYTAEVYLGPPRRSAYEGVGRGGGHLMEWRAS